MAEFTAVAHRQELEEAYIRQRVRLLDSQIDQLTESLDTKQSNSPSDPTDPTNPNSNDPNNSGYGEEGDANGNGGVNNHIVGAKEGNGPAPEPSLLRGQVCHLNNP